MYFGESSTAITTFYFYLICIARSEERTKDKEDDYVVYIFLDF